MVFVRAHASVSCTEMFGSRTKDSYELILFSESIAKIHKALAGLLVRIRYTQSVNHSET